MQFSNISSLFIYLIVFSASAAIYSRCTKELTKLKQIICMALSSLLPALLAEFRYGVGTDYFSYNDIFTYIRNGPIGNLSIHDWIEPGFKALVKILSFLGNNQFIFGAIAFITAFVFEVALLFWKDEIDLGIAVFAYYLILFYISFNAVRQMLAVSIVFLALQYIYKDKRKAILLLIIAVLIHTASLIVLPLLFLWDEHNQKTNYQVLSIYTICLVAGAVLYPYVLNFLTNLIGRYQSYETGFQSNRDFYIKIVCLLFIFLYYKALKMYDSRMTLNIYIYCYAFIISALGFFIPYIKRITYPYEASICIILAAVPKVYGDDFKNKLISRWIIITGIIIYFILAAYFAGAQQIFPYTIKWSN